MGAVDRHHLAQRLGQLDDDPVAVPQLGRVGHPVELVAHGVVELGHPVTQGGHPQTGDGVEVAAALDVDELIALGCLDDDRFAAGERRHLGEAVPDDRGVAVDPAHPLRTGWVARRTPSLSIRTWSWDSSALGVVSRFSPRKMLLAPARRQSVWSSWRTN